MTPSENYFMRSHWEAQAEQYCQNRSWSNVDQRVYNLISDLTPRKILEVGIGPGLIASRVLADHPEIRWFGMDVSPTFLGNAGKLTEQKSFLTLADGRHLPFKEHSFNAVLEMVTIHHFRREVIPEVVIDIARVLQIGGTFIAVEDWATEPERECEQLAYTLQKKRPTTKSGEEYHPSEAEWQTMFEDAALRVMSLERIARPLNFHQFRDVTDPESQNQLATLRSMWGDQTPQTTMSIFICQKE